MTRIQFAILVGFFAGISALILIARLISNPTIARQSGNCPVSEDYPEDVRRWCGPIQQNAVEHGLDPNLVAAVMLQESGGNPQAYSKSGAVGLMQVMPRNGLAAQFMCNGNPCFSNRPSMDELYDPEFNIAYGTKMLSGLNSKYGNMRDALKAYGPMDMGYRYADIVLEIYHSRR
jgi:soluble lytic murein transglycosylase-like protein